MARIRLQAAMVLAAAACSAGSHDAADAASARSAEPPVPSAVRRALDAAERTLRTRGLGRIGGEPNGFVLERRAEVVPMPLRAGRCYTFVAASTLGVEDLDVMVFDAEGAQVAHDTGRDRRAAARLCPPQAGTYHLAVRAAAGNGVFALRTFEGTPGTGGGLDDLWGPEPTETR